MAMLAALTQPQVQAMNEWFEQVDLQARHTTDIDRRIMVSINTEIDTRIANAIGAHHAQIDAKQTQVDIQVAAVATQSEGLRQQMEALNASLEAQKLERDEMKKTLNEAFKERSEAIEALNFDVESLEGTKDQIIEELNKKKDEMASLRDATQIQLNDAQAVRQQSSSMLTAKVAEAYNALETKTTERIQQQDNKIAEIMRSSTGGSPAGLSASGSGGSDQVIKSLINPKGMKLPPFPEKPENVAAFKQWFRKFTQHCSRCTSKFPMAEVMFEKVKNCEKPLAGLLGYRNWVMC